MIEVGTPSRGPRDVAVTGAPALPERVGVLPLRDTVTFPDMLIPLNVGQERSIELVNDVLRGDRSIAMVASANPEAEAPGPEDLYSVGVLGVVARMIRVPDGTLRVLIQGGQRVRIENWLQTEPYLVAEVAEAPDVVDQTPELTALMRNVQQTFTDIVEQVPYLPEELQIMVANVDDPSVLAHLIAGALRLKTAEKQALLEEVDVGKRLRRLSEILARELEVVAIGSKIQSQVQSELDKGQREYFLRQQLKAIQEELGEADEMQAEITELREQLDAIKLPDEVRKQAERELSRLERLQPAMAEYGVVRGYLEWIAALPWDKSTEDNLDLKHARKVLDEDHYDIEQVKDRILEFLAVRKLKPDARGTILCFVGPPGVGKTSLGRSIARALGSQVRAPQRRRGARRGRDPRPPAHVHRRDAGDDHPGDARRRRQQPAADDRRDRQDGRRLPRRSVERDARGARPRAEPLVPRPLPGPAVRLVGSDVRDHRQHAGHDPRAAPRPDGGDPARGLHGGGEAPDRKALPRPAPDRAQRPDQEQARLHRPRVARDHLRLHARGRRAPARARDRQRLPQGRAPGRRGERQAQGDRDRAPRRELLGRQRFYSEVRRRTSRPGVATGLAWTPVGGDVLFIEATAMPGKGNLTITGQLGDVMKESAQAALSYVRSNADELLPDLDEDWFAHHDIHIHVPAGAIPKDGPSAGVAMTTALESLLSGRPVRSDVAMTGEITLTGQVLPIGGLKEKALAAQRSGIKVVIAPARNESDIDDIPEHLRKDLEFKFVDEIGEVLEVALQRRRAPRPRAAARRDGQLR